MISGCQGCLLAGAGYTIPYHTFFCIDAIAYLGREDKEGKEEAYLMTMT